MGEHHADHHEVEGGTGEEEVNAKLKELIKLNERTLKAAKRQAALTQKARDKALVRLNKAHNALLAARDEHRHAEKDYVDLRLDNNTAHNDVYHVQRRLLQLDELRKAK